MNDITTLFSKDENCVTRNIAGETIIVPVRASVGELDSIYTLNEVGSAVWELIDGRTSIGKIIKTVCAQYEVTENEARKDVCELIDSLKAEGLIRSEQIASD